MPSWIVVLLALLGFTVLAGHGVTGVWRGAQPVVKSILEKSKEGGSNNRNNGFLALSHRGAQRGLSSLIANAAERRICLLYRDYTAGSVGKGEALAKFDEIWELYLETPCGDPTLGTSGKCCIEERCRGGDFDWFAKYRDPIAGGRNGTSRKLTRGVPMSWVRPSMTTSKTAIRTGRPTA